MSDLDTIHHGSGRIEETPSHKWAQMRERMRALIHAEVDRLHPMEDARRALELIIESSVRPSEVGGQLKLTVIDQNGQPRTTDKGGHTAEFTVQDLVDELRMTHPVLFKSPPKIDRPSIQAASSSEHPPQALDKHPPQKAPERDWLKIDRKTSEAAIQPSEPVATRALFQLRKGRARLHGWSTDIAKIIKSSRSRSGPVKAAAVRDGIARSAERAQTFFNDVQERPISRRPGFALGAVAIAACIGIGAFLFLRQDNVSQANIEGPTETGGIASSAAASTQAAPSRSSSGRTLRGVPDVIDTATLSLQGEVVRLFGVEWAPGAGKPEDLTRYLQGREVSCEPAGGNDTYRCKIGEQDLSRVILYNGGGQPTPEATPELRAAADKAREAKIGVWSK